MEAWSNNKQTHAISAKMISKSSSTQKKRRQKPACINVPSQMMAEIEIVAWWQKNAATCQLDFKMQLTEIHGSPAAEKVINIRSSIKRSSAEAALWAEQGSCEPISQLKARERLTRFFIIAQNAFKRERWMAHEILGPLLTAQRALKREIGSQGSWPLARWTGRPQILIKQC